MNLCTKSNACILEGQRNLKMNDFASQKIIHKKVIMQSDIYVECR